MAREQPKSQAAPVAAAAAPAPASLPAKPSAPRFKVWDHGSLQCDGVAFAPGEELPLSAEQIAAYGIGDVVVLIEE